MKVQDVLTAKGQMVETIRPDAKVLIAVHRMRMQNVGALVVSRDGERVEGVLSERDVVRGLTRHGADLLDMSVVAVMSRTVPVCSPGDSLVTVMDQMTRTRNRHVPVVDGTAASAASSASATWSSTGSRTWSWRPTSSATPTSTRH